MTPLHIRILLHYYISPERFEPYDAPAVVSYTQKLIELGALEKYGRDFKVTGLGHAWVKLICATPLPVRESRFVDPRTGASIE